MTYLPSLPDGAVLLDVFRAYPGTSRPLLFGRPAYTSWERLGWPAPASVSSRRSAKASVARWLWFAARISRVFATPYKT
jgi:hypothetical protein